MKQKENNNKVQKSKKYKANPEENLKANTWLF